MVNIVFGTGPDTATGDLFSAGIPKLKARISSLEQVSAGTAASTSGQSLRANPLPPSTAYTAANTLAFNNIDTGSVDQYIDLTYSTKGALVLYIACDAARQNGFKVKITSNTNYNVFAIVDGVDQYMDYRSSPAEYATNGRIRLEYTKKLGLRLLFGNQTDGVLVENWTMNFGRVLTTPTGTYVSATNTTALNGIADGLTEASTPLVVSSVLVDRDTRVVKADIKYFVPTTDTLLAQVEDDSGNVLFPFAPCSVVENASAGVAKVTTTSVVPTSMLETDFKVRFKFQAKSDVAALADAYYPARTQWGGNLAGPVPYAMYRAMYTNLAVGGYWQDKQDSYAEAKVGTGSTKIDAVGNPMKTGMTLRMSTPDMPPQGSTTVELTWTGGPVSVSLENFGAGVVIGPQQKIDSNTIRWTISRDFEDTTSGFAAISLTFDAITVGNEPKNIFFCKMGADKTKRIAPEYVEFLKEFNGPIRLMDVTPALDPQGYETVPGWSNRAPFNIISKSRRGMAYEDFVLLSQLTGRPLWVCCSLAMGNSPEGLDDLYRMARLLDTGEGGVGISGGVVGTIIFEFGNENWAPGNQNWDYAARIGRPYKSYIDDGQDGANKHGASCIGRNLMQAAMGQKIRDAIPTWRTRAELTVNLQTGTGDAGNLQTDKTSFAAAKPFIDSCATAPYIPFDSTAGSGTKPPADHSALSIYNWMSLSLAALPASLTTMRKRNLAAGFGKMRIYEFNIARPTVPTRTFEEDFLWLSSKYFFDLMYNYLKLLDDMGGTFAFYNDTGRVGIGQQWCVDTGPGARTNAMMDAYRAYVGKPTSRNYLYDQIPAKTNPVISGAPSATTFTITPAVWPAGTTVYSRVVNVTNPDGTLRSYNLISNAIDRSNMAVGATIEVVERGDIGDSTAFSHSNKITLT